MDPERQPLLDQSTDLRRRAFRPLTFEEVLQSRQDYSWKRARLCIVLMFWAIMAMFLTVTVSILVTTPKCNTFDNIVPIVPTVPPVHLTLAPLMSASRMVKDPNGMPDELGFSK